MELSPIKVQQYAEAKGISFEEAGKELGLNPELVEEMQTGLNNGANWGNIGDKPEFSTKTAKKEDVKEEKSFVEKYGFQLGGAAAGVVGTALLATGVGSPIVGLALLGAAATGLLASCQEGDTHIENEYNTDYNNTINITLKSEDKDEIKNAMKEGFDAVLKVINDIKTENQYNAEQTKELLNQVINLLVANNSKLDGIAKDLKANNANQEEIIKMLTNLTNTVNVLTDLTAKVSTDVEVNGQSVKAQLTEILNAINNKDLNTGSLNEQLGKLQELLQAVIANQEVSISLQGDQYKTTQDILDKLENIKFSGEGVQLDALLGVLNEIKGITQNIDDKLTDINNTINTIKDQMPKDKDVQAALDAIMQLVKDGNAKADVTNELLQKLLKMYNSGGNGSGGGCGISQEDFAKLLELVANNGAKIDETNRLLAKIQNQDADFQKTVLEAIANIGFDNSAADLLEKILNKLDNMDASQKENAKKILDAIAKIQIVGGGGGDVVVDLSSLEDMMAELLKLVQDNNGLLTDIDGKMDVINMTVEAAKQEIMALLGDKFKAQEANFNKIIDLIQGLGNGEFDDTALMNKLDVILKVLEKIGDKGYDDTVLMAKLDAILNAIKDHNVTVDITGKVTCDCDCGSGNHEGVLGDLENILG